MTDEPLPGFDVNVADVASVGACSVSGADGRSVAALRRCRSGVV